MAQSWLALPQQRRLIPDLVTWLAGTDTAHRVEFHTAPGPRLFGFLGCKKRRCLLKIHLLKMGCCKWMSKRREWVKMNLRITSKVHIDKYNCYIYICTCHHDASYISSKSLRLQVLLLESQGFYKSAMPNGGTTAGGTYNSRKWRSVVPSAGHQLHHSPSLLNPPAYRLCSAKS